MIRPVKRTIAAIFTVALLELLLVAALGSEARAHLSSLSPLVKQDRLARAVQQQQEPARRVKGRTLTSHSLPPIKIKFDTAFKYVGSQKFLLYERAQVEQFFFVASDKGSIKRVLMVQFEGYLPDNTHTYNYSIGSTVKLGGLDFMADTAVVNVPAFRKQYPDSDAGRAATFLETKGYRLAGEDIVYQRFIRLVDEARRNELLIIYYEDLSGTGLTAADLSEQGRAAGERAHVFQEVQKRALKSFTVEK
jgi:hypothetical protein